MIDEVQEFYQLPDDKIKKMSLFRLANKYKNLNKLKKRNYFILANEIGKMLFGEKEVENEDKTQKKLTNKEIKKFDNFKKDKSTILNILNKNKNVYKKFLKGL